MPSGDRIFFAGCQFPFWVITRDFQIFKLTATSVADEAAAGKKKDDRIDQGDCTKHTKSPSDFTHAEQHHRQHSGKNDDDDPRYLWKIFTAEQFMAAAHRTASHMLLIIEYLIPVQVEA